MEEGLFEKARKLQGAELRAILETIYARLLKDDATFAANYSPDYVQRVNGVVTHYADILRLYRHLKSTVATTKHTVFDAIAYGDTIADRHMVEHTFNDGTRMVSAAHCFFTIKDGKVIEVNEVAHDIEGRSVFVRDKDGHTAFESIKD